MTERHGCILVVDDNPTNLKLACDVLEFDGYEVLAAGDAEAALEIIKAGPSTSSSWISLFRGWTA